MQQRISKGGYDKHPCRVSKETFTGTIIYIADGDTIDVERLEMGSIIPKIWRIRIANLDAPELNGNHRGAAIASRDWLAANVSGHEATIIPTRAWRDLYGRVIAHVYIDGKSLAETVISAGHGKLARRGFYRSKPIK